jgi:hypothetical protein
MGIMATVSKPSHSHEKLGNLLISQAFEQAETKGINQQAI